MEDINKYGVPRIQNLPRIYAYEIGIAVSVFDPLDGAAFLMQTQKGRDVVAGEIMVGTAVASFYCGGCGALAIGALDGALLGEAFGAYSAEKSGGDLLTGVAIGGMSGAVGGYYTAAAGGIGEGGAIVGGTLGGAVEGGGTALVHGGSFETVMVGAMMGAMEGEASGMFSTGMNDLYTGTTGYGIDMGPGGEAAAKGRPGDLAAYPGKNNVMVGSPFIKNPCWYCEGAPLSKFLNQVYSINALAGFHDFINPSGPALILTFIPTIPVAAAVTYGGYMANFAFAPVILVDQTK